MAPRLRPLVHESLPDAEGLARATAFAARVARRRTVRDFAPDPVSRALIEQCLAAAGTAPSGAHQQPWHFVAIGCNDVALRQRIRAAAEEEEREFYQTRAPQEWLAALAPLGTDSNKPFLEVAPWLIAIFVRAHGVGATGQVVKHYYATESVGIATGILVTALHDAGLVTLTHTPSPMGFLNTLLGRPANERPFLLLVVGHPAPDAQVPDISRRPLDEIATFLP
ncbi:MAG: nitroreductase family protein [Acidobacteriota bacterium]